MARAASRRGERHDNCCGCPANRISNWICVWLRYSRADLGPSSRGIPQTTPRAIRLLTNEMPGLPPAPSICPPCDGGKQAYENEKGSNERGDRFLP